MAWRWWTGIPAGGATHAVSGTLAAQATTTSSVDWTAKGGAAGAGSAGTTGSALHTSGVSGAAGAGSAGTTGSGAKVLPGSGSLAAQAATTSSVDWTAQASGSLAGQAGTSGSVGWNPTVVSGVSGAALAGTTGSGVVTTAVSGVAGAALAGTTGSVVVAFNRSGVLAALARVTGSATMDEGLVLASSDKTSTRVLLAGRVLPSSKRSQERIADRLRTARGKVVTLDRSAQEDLVVYRLQVDATLRSELDTFFRSTARGRLNAIACKRQEDGSWRAGRLDRDSLSWSEVADGLWEVEVGFREVVS